jgi:hypothetical protein
MALNINIEVSERSSTLEIPEDVATVLEETYQALKELPQNRQAVSDFDTEAEAKTFARQARAWAKDNELKYSDKKDKELPKRVTFRIYKPKPKDTEEVKTEEVKTEEVKTDTAKSKASK